MNNLLEKIGNLSDLWNKNKLLFFIALPLILIAIGLKLFLDYNANAGRQDIIDAENKDNELGKDANKLNDKANDHVAKADKIAEDINNIDSDLDWHKKMGDS